jgi:hypothetical protein
MLVLGWRVAWPVCAIGGARALLCASSLATACESGLYTAPQMSYLKASASSRDARDLIWHRSVVKTCAGLRKEDACAAQIDATRKANNALIHALEDADGSALDAAMSLHMQAWKVRRK